ncbi:MAG: hypothetical protein RL701_1890, partial [Pseudomonadota bacterium]
MTHFGPPPFGRRSFMSGALTGLGGTALMSLLARRAAADGGGSAQSQPPGPHFAPKAKRAIWLFMGGGPSQLDLFDYKPGLKQRFDKDLPDSVRKGRRLTGMTSNQDRFPVAPSHFAFERAGESGAWVSDL